MIEALKSLGLITEQETGEQNNIEASDNTRSQSSDSSGMITMVHRPNLVPVGSDLREVKQGSKKVRKSRLFEKSSDVTSATRMGMRLK